MKKLLQSYFRLLRKKTLYLRDPETEIIVKSVKDGAGFFMNVGGIDQELDSEEDIVVRAVHAKMLVRKMDYDIQGEETETENDDDEK